MKSRTLSMLIVFACLALPIVASALSDPQPPSPANLAAMMEKAKKFIEPGEHHKLLEKFLGRWDVEARFFMGDQASPAEKSTLECKWLIKGRWLQADIKGTIMGRPFHGVSIVGYDNFKQSYVVSSVTNGDTAMNHSEGDMTPDGKALITYGQLDEYLTGEHDKMVKYVWRFVSDDKIVHEIHDLPIGEKNTKVLEFTSTRAKD